MSDRIEKTRRFLQLEVEHRLFDLQTQAGKPYWYVLRYAVLRYLFGTMEQRVRSFKKQGMWAKSWRFLGIGLRWLKVFLFPPSSKRYLVYMNSRVRDAEGRQYDLHLNDLLHRIADTSFLIESHDSKNEHPYRYPEGLLYPVLIYQPLLTRRLVRWLVPETFDALRDFLSTYFPDKPIDLHFLRITYLIPQLDYQFYRLLLRRLRPKAVFFVQNNVQYGLLRAAHELNIRTLEVQHGISYKYVSPVSELPEGVRIPAPNYLLCFSEYARQADRYPAGKKVVIGNSILSQKNEVSPQTRNRFRTLMVVPQLSDSAVLEGLSLAFAQKHPEWQLIFKVKPSNFDQIEHCQRRFASQDNIQVVAGERDMMALLDEVHAVLLTHSTTFYEAMHRQVKCLIYKRSNYLMFQDSFDLPNVYLIDTLEEVSTALRAPIRATPELDGLFYQSFDPEALEQVLEEINR